MAANTTTRILGLKSIFAPIKYGSSSFSVAEGASLRLVCYNILAQAYATSALLPHCPSACLRWEDRSQALVARLLSFEADLLCLQEVDEFESFYKEQMDRHGYSSVYVKRPGSRKDGCAIFYRHERVSLIQEESIQYNDLVPQIAHRAAKPVETSAASDRNPRYDPKVRLKRDCVGIMAAFRALYASDKVFILANTHIFWNPDFEDVKLAQVNHLKECVFWFKGMLESKVQCDVPAIICGDFNSVPGSQVYDYLTLQLKETPFSSYRGSVPRCCYLPLHSVYAAVKGEPIFTNCTYRLFNTLDYIFCSCLESVKPVSLLEVPTPRSEDVVGGLPNYNHPSDHLPIGMDFLLPTRH